MGFVVYNSVEDVNAFQKYTESVADHFGSDTLAEHYLNGFINWDGSPTEESIY
jgi:hypothetical protein